MIAKFPTKAILLALATLGPAAALADEPRTIRPGFWDYTTSTILPGSSNGKQCVRPDQIDDFLSGPHNKHYHCTYPSKFVGEGRASFDGVCVGKHGDRYKLKVEGTYSQTRFTLNGHVQGALLGIPLTSPISIDAKWIGPDCPAGSK